ncbi:uncharacterized protein LOC126590244 [Malus sylvestris]|uniref:uncharacterized protein LOC126590244 n=1 Tax=Malus sylvestris TaxID=3752 RepID=UPI0021AC8A30|nr:uncharacterized protein LOC126590244 [Malus sylvestris]
MNKKYPQVAPFGLIFTASQASPFSQIFVSDDRPPLCMSTSSTTTNQFIFTPTAKPNHNSSYWSTELDSGEGGNYQVGDNIGVVGSGPLARVSDNSTGLSCGIDSLGFMRSIIFRDCGIVLENM